MRTFADQPENLRHSILAAPSRDRRQRLGPVSPIEGILRLQRTIGNQAVQRLLKEESRGDGPAVFSRLRLADARGGGDDVLLDQRDRDAVVTTSGTAVTTGVAAVAGAGAATAISAPASSASAPVPASAAPPAPAPAARPKPVNVRNGPSHAPIDSGDSVGMSIAITITSSSGVDADMAAIQDSEEVGLSENHSGSMAGVAPMASHNSGFMAGFPIPDDQHAWSKAFLLDRFDNHGGAGSFEKEQLDVFTDAAGGVTAATAIPASGYIIKREISASGASVVLKTSKRAAAASANGFSSSAGPSPTQSETVVLRP